MNGCVDARHSSQVPVPISIKGRIILEILEGMVYLTERRVIHKDIKPGNILVDKDFHIKVRHALRPHVGDPDRAGVVTVT